MPNLNFWGKLNKLREEIKLEPERKLKIREYLIREINVATVTNNITRHEKQWKSFWNRLVVSHYQRKYIPVFASIVLIIIFGGGVSFAAESSLPGDILYPVKVGINEEVRGAFIFNEEAKAEWEANLATRRLEEAELLTVNGKIKNDTQESIENNFEKHSKKVTESITKFQSETNITAAASISSKFESSLRAHEQILKKLGDEASPEVQTHSRSVEAKVKARLHSTASKRSELDNDIASHDGGVEEQNKLKSVALRKINSAENVITSLYNFIGNKKEKIGIDAAAETEVRIKAARDLIVQAKAKVDLVSYGEAFNLAEQAIRVAEEARLLVGASTDLKLDGRLIRSSVNNEDNDDFTIGTQPEDEAGINMTGSIPSTTKGQDETESKSRRRGGDR